MFLYDSAFFEKCLKSFSNIDRKANSTSIKTFSEKNSLHFELMIFLLPRKRGKRKMMIIEGADEDILNLSQAGGNCCAPNPTALFQKQLLENEGKGIKLPA